MKIQPGIRGLLCPVQDQVEVDCVGMGVKPLAFKRSSNESLSELCERRE